jgi:hypothetical protein
VNAHIAQFVTVRKSIKTVLILVRARLYNDGFVRTAARHSQSKKIAIASIRLNCDRITTSVVVAMVTAQIDKFRLHHPRHD